MTNVGARDDYRRWKPPNLQHYYTVAEVADLVECERATLRQWLHRGHVPEPIRVRVGRLHIRLFSPQEVESIKKVVKARKVKRR